MSLELTRWGASLRIMCWRLVIVWWPEPYAWLEQLRRPHMEFIIIGLASIIVMLAILFGR